MSDGSSFVNTVTSIPPKLIGGALSPPNPCANASSTKNGIAASTAPITRIFNL